MFERRRTWDAEATENRPTLRSRFTGARQNLEADLAKLTELIWRACSVIAHGDMSATINVIQREEVPGAVGGSVDNRVTVNVAGLHRMTAITVAITKAAWSWYDQRGRAPY